MLNEGAKRAAVRATESGFVRLQAEPTVDGVLSAAILSRALCRASVAHHVRFGGEEFPEANEVVFLLDRPPQSAEELDRRGESAIAIHHGVPAGEPMRALDLHPRLGGYDPSREACTAALSYLVSQYVAPDARDAPLAVAGAIACRQHLPALSGLNAAIREENASLLSAAPPLCEQLTTPDALASLFDPYVRGVSGKARQAKALLAEAGAPAPDAKRFSSLLSMRLLRQGASASASLAHAAPRVRAGTRELSEFAFALEAAIVLEGPDVAFSCALGDPALREPVEAAAARARAEVLLSLLRIEGDALPDSKGWMDLRGLGPFSRLCASLASDYLSPRPLVATGEGCAFVRARPEHVRSGLRAIHVSREASRTLGGGARGHDLSCDVTLPPGSEGAFVKALEGAVAP